MLVPGPATHLPVIRPRHWSRARNPLAGKSAELLGGTVNTLVWLPATRCQHVLNRGVILGLQSHAPVAG